jgi:hypothetical protein
MEVKHVLNQLIRGQITTSTTTKLKKKYLHHSLRFFAYKLSIDIIEFTPHKKIKSLRLIESPTNTSTIPGIFFSGHVST